MSETSSARMANLASQVMPQKRASPSNDAPHSKAPKIADFVAVPHGPPDTHIDVRMPALVGQRVEDLETPFLLVDLDAFDANCTAMSKILEPFAAKGLLLRPHVKAHKCSELARRQLQAHGALARGVCCQTVREAEAMVRGGVRDVLVCNILADVRKARRLAVLASAGAQVAVMVDSLGGLALFKDALRFSPGSHLDVMIELGVSCRTGVESEAVDVTVAIAKDVEATAGLRLRGLQVYNGVAQHLRSAAQRKSSVSGSCDVARKHVAALRAAGISAELIVSGGGTGTLPFEAESGLYSELQCGSYVFNDGDYARNQEMYEWRQSLFVVGSVIGSYQRAGAVGGPHWVVDVGLKSVAFDSGPPIPRSPAGAVMTYTGLGDEHGAVRFADGSTSEALEVGTRLWHTPGHCDPTFNMYDFAIGVRGGVVEAICRIDGRNY